MVDGGRFDSSWTSRCEASHLGNRFDFPEKGGEDELPGVVAGTGS